MKITLLLMLVTINTYAGSPTLYKEQDKVKVTEPKAFSTEELFHNCDKISTFTVQEFFEDESKIFYKIIPLGNENTDHYYCLGGAHIYEKYLKLVK